MDSSATTEELDAVGRRHPSEDRPTAEGRTALDAPTAEAHAAAPAPRAAVRAAPPRSAAAQCAACGAVLASDQRYCVECGQRLGAARLPFMDEPGSYARPLAPPTQPAKRRLSVNSTLIAGVGTLLLAMGIGILIGRSSPGSSSSRTPPIQVVGVPGATGASTAGGTSGSTEAAGSTSEGSTSSGHSAASKAKAAAKPAKAKLPPPKVVTVGSPGKGKGYEKGHFTGNFFGKGQE